MTFGVEIHLKGAKNANEGIGIYLNLVATTDQEKPALGGSIVFTGATIYYTYYAEIGGGEVESVKHQVKTSGRTVGSDQGATSTGRKTEVKLKKDELRKLVEIFPYAEWPNKNTITSDTSKTNLNQVRL